MGVTRLISFRPARHVLRRALGAPFRDIEAAAVDRWQIAPEEKRWVRPAIFLREQLDLIRGVEFGTVDEVVKDFEGGFETTEPATHGLRLQGVDLVDGVLYCGEAARHLRRRARPMPACWIGEEVAAASLYESWIGNQWFGNWLLGDTLTYRLAESMGNPVTTRMASSGHMARYEQLLGMAPRRIERARFEELILFNDMSHNSHMAARARDFRARVLDGRAHASHPGVYLLRRNGGIPRSLVNEAALTTMLAERYGFTVLDPMDASVDEVAAACAGARVVAGIEGSHLCHGMMVMPDDACLLVLQPPYRVVSFLKAITDYRGQEFAFVVGDGGDEPFSVDLGDVERTLALVAARRA